MVPEDESEGSVHGSRDSVDTVHHAVDDATPGGGVIFSAYNALDDALDLRRDITEPTMRARRPTVTNCHKPGPTSAEAAERDRPARICPDVWLCDSRPHRPLDSRAVHRVG